MTITLLNFPDHEKASFEAGEVVSGTVRFTANHAGNYTTLGFQVVVDYNKSGFNSVNTADGIKVIHAVRTDSSTHFSVGETREYPVTFTVPDHPSYQGELFDVRLGVRGYAVPAKRQNVSLRKPANYYPVSKPWYYALNPDRFQVKSQIPMVHIPNGGNPEVFFVIALPFIVALLGLGSWGILAVVFSMIGLGYFSLVREEPNAEITTPVVMLENRGQTLLVKISFCHLPEKGVRLTAGYEVRERHRYVNNDGEQITYEPTKSKEPRQKLELNENGEGLVEHQFLPLPPPKMWGDIGFEWVYRVTAHLPNEKLQHWDGVITIED